MAKKSTEPDEGVTKTASEPTSGAGGNGESPSGYFRRLFTENPKLLEGRSNDEILRRWLADHPGESAVPDRIKGILANVKSIMRKTLRKKPGRRAKEEKAVKAILVVEITPPTKVAAKTLEALEEQIDECMTVAKNLDPEGLAEVVAVLRRARNTVVWKIGE